MATKHPLGADGYGRRAYGLALLALVLAPAAPAVAQVAPAVRGAVAAVVRPLVRPLGNRNEMRVVELVNAERRRRGLAPLTPSKKLMDVSRAWSGTQASRRRMYHSRNGYAENVAYGQPTPEAVVNTWMNSRGHRANILSSRAREIGVGCVAAADGRLYWTQSFL